MAKELLRQSAEQQQPSRPDVLTERNHTENISPDAAAKLDRLTAYTTESPELPLLERMKAIASDIVNDLAGQFSVVEKHREQLVNFFNNPPAKFDREFAKAALMEGQEDAANILRSVYAAIIARQNIENGNIA